MRDDRPWVVGTKSLSLRAEAKRTLCDKRYKLDLIPCKPTQGASTFGGASLDRSVRDLAGSRPKSCGGRDTGSCLGQ